MNVTSINVMLKMFKVKTHDNLIQFICKVESLNSDSVNVFLLRLLLKTVSFTSILPFHVVGISQCGP